MALRLRAVLTDDVAIPRVFDDPAWIAAADLSGAFATRITRLEREKQRIGLEQHFAARPLRQDSTADQDLWRRLQGLRAEAAAAQPIPATTQPSHASASIAAAVAILAGHPAPSKPDHAAQLIELDQQIATLQAGLRDQDEIVTEIAGALAVKFAMQVKPEWDRLAIQMFRGAQQLAGAASQFRAFRARLIEAGIREGCEAILRTPRVQSPLILGSEDDFNSEISFWRKTLEDWKML